MALIDELIDELRKAEESATMKRASFGFPNDRIEIKTIHCPDADSGHPGDVLHPDEYIKRITRLYRESWIIPRIRRVIELLELHKKAIDNAERIASVLSECEDLPSQLRRLSSGLN